LNPSTAYHFDIFCDNRQGLKTETGDKYFTTLFTISNVGGFSALAGISEITLTWKNPVSDNFKSVTIVRNLEFFPFNINDGEIIYQGKGEYFVDKGLTQGKDYYYAIFAEGLNGSWSSGAIAYAKIKIPSVAEEPVEILEPDTDVPASRDLKFNDFDFYSEGEKLFLINENKLEMGSGKILTASIAKEKVPENYKKMIVKLQTAENNFYYLFSLSGSGVVYSTSFLIPENGGSYLITILFIDEKNKIIAKADGELLILSDKEISFVKKIDILFWVKTNINIFIFILILLFLLILLLLLFKRRKAKKEEEEFKNINQI
jgi:hypothetical protein